jgi:hypothetical protein
MKKIICIFLFISCSQLRNNKTETPSWVEGIRSGSESLRVVNGNKIFYRRILKANNEDEQSVCAKVLDVAARDIQTEFLVVTKIPYTLEYLHYDDKYEDCSVTLSISTQMSSRLIEIKEIKKDHNEIVSHLEDKWREARKEKESIERRNQELEAYIRQNQHLLQKYNDQVSNLNHVMAMLKDRRERASESALTGLSKRDFRNLVGHDVSIVYDLNSKCWSNFYSAYISYHGATIVCWSGSDRSFVRGYCDIAKGSCFTRNP